MSPDVRFVLQHDHDAPDPHRTTMVFPSGTTRPAPRRRPRGNTRWGRALLARAEPWEIVASFAMGAAMTAIALMVETAVGLLLAAGASAVAGMALLAASVGGRTSDIVGSTARETPAAGRRKRPKIEVLRV